jgi:transcription elongation factor GreA
MSKEFSLTKDGIKALEKELNDLIGQRGTIAERLAIARSYGDLSENSEYDSAKNDQQVLEKRIGEIQYILKNVEVIQEKKSDKVILGSSVDLESEGKAFSFKVVGKVEANPAEGRISNESPVGKSIFGAKVGDEVEVELPAGIKKYKIKKIS